MKLLSLKTNMKSRLHVKTILFLGFLFLLFQFPIQAQNIDAEEEIVKINKLAEVDLKKAIKYADSILQYDFIEKEEVTLTTGYICVRAHFSKKAIGLFKEVEKRNLGKESSEELIDSYIGLGQANSLLGDKNEALNYTLKALDYAKKNNYINFESDALSLLAVIYYSSGDYHNAIKFTKQILRLDKNDKKSLSTDYINLAVFHQKLKQFDSAQSYNVKALKLIKALNNNEGLATLYNNMASIDEKLGNNNKAMRNYRKSISLHDKIHTNSTGALRNIAKLYVNLKKMDTAVFYYEKALKIDKLKQDNKSQELDYRFLLEIAIRQKSFKKMLNYLHKKDSLNALNTIKENKDKLNLIDSKYNKAIVENKLKQKIALNEKNNIIFAVFAVSLLFLGAFLFQRNRKLQLKLKHDKLMLEQKVLRSQMNPHFIFNSLTSIQKNLLGDDLLKSSTSLSKFAKLIRQNFEFTSKELIGLDEDLDALKNYIETQQMRFDYKFNYEINVDNNIDLSYIEIPPMLLQPFVENAIEHGLKAKKEKGNLIINIIENRNLIHFEIIDDGVGYNKIEKDNDREHAIDIFFNRLKLRGLNEDKSFSIISENGKGTKITFSLKL